MSIRQTLLRAAVRGGVNVQVLLGQQKRRLDLALSGLALASLDPASLREWTIWAYGRGNRFQSVGLYDWEERWFGRDLPAAPGRVLVAAAGTGREVAYLDGKGYASVAFDPVVEAVELARQRPDLPKCLAFLQGSFEGLITPSDEVERGFLAEVERHSPYDAVLIGWTAINHLPRREARRELLLALRRLCPGGPVLFSYWQQEGLPPPSRAWHAGWRLGSWLAGQPGADPAEAAGDVFSSYHGYAHHFTEDEIRDLAASTGYRLADASVLHTAHEHPHATFIPR